MVNEVSKQSALCPPSKTWTYSESLSERNETNQMERYDKYTAQKQLLWLIIRVNNESRQNEINHILQTNTSVLSHNY